MAAINIDVFSYLLIHKLLLEYAIQIFVSLQSLGNHEFDEAISGVVPFIRNLSSPVLSANLILDSVAELKDESNLKSSIVKTFGKVKVGIIGYLTPETKYLAPINSVEYEDEVIAIKREVSKLKSQGVDILIALGHSGYMKDMAIAQEVDDIDLVIGGHSNTFLCNNNQTKEKPELPQGPYPSIIRQPSGRTVPVVQAYAYTKYLGKLNLVFDKYGELTKYNGDPILLNQDIPKDPEVFEIVKKYRTEIDILYEVVVGQSLVYLNGENCRISECVIGDFITDAVIQYMRNNTDSCVNIVIIQGGRIRASIEKPKKPYNMTRGDWVTVLPFSDVLVIGNISGYTLVEALEHSIDTWRQIDSTGQFLQFSGMNVIYDLSKPPGLRVISVKVVNNAQCNESNPEMKDLELDEYYNVVMPSFLAEGGDGYINFKNIQKEILSISELDCVIDYFKSNNLIAPKIDERIILLNENIVYVNKEQANGESKGVSIKISLYLMFIILFVKYTLNYN